MEKMQKHSEKNKKSSFSIWTLPVLLVLGVLPLITQMVTLDSRVEELFFGAKMDENYDFFLYWKGIFLMVLVGIMLVSMIVFYVTNKNQPKLGKAFIPLGIFALLIFISSLASKYSYFVVHGIDESYQSMFILLSYCVLPVYAYLVVNSQETLKQIFTWWTVGIFILVFIGVMQLFIKDFWATWLGRHLILPISEWGTNLSFKFEPGRVYLSQYNPNYVGPLAVMIIMVYGTLTIFTKNKKRLLFAAVTAGMLLCLMGSLSKNGVISLVFSLVLLLLFLRKKFKKYWIGMVAAVLTLVCVIFVTDMTRNHYITNAFKKNLKMLAGKEEVQDMEKVKLEDIQTTVEDVVVYYDKNELHVQTKYNEDANTLAFTIKDQDGKTVDFKDADGDAVYEFTDERFSTIQLKSAMNGNVPCFQLKIGDVWWTFTNKVGTNGYYYLSVMGYYTKMVKAPTAVFTNMGKLGSGRGYIWARSIPILKETIFIGKGADNYWAYFPHFDYVEAWRNGYYAKTISTPHNMFLQIGINSGVISLIAFLAFFLIYFVDCIKLYWKENFDNYLSQVGLALCLAVFGYMISGFLNDMMVCVTPVFFCLIGIGMAVNRMYRKEMQ